jgi:hypothetical protein
LELTFLTAELRDVCEKREVAMARIGYAAARELAERLADIQAVDNVAELSQLLGDTVEDRTALKKAVRLAAGFEVMFESGHTHSNPDWASTSRIKIVAIEPGNG